MRGALAAVGLILAAAPLFGAYALAQPPGAAALAQGSQAPGRGGQAGRGGPGRGGLPAAEMATLAARPADTRLADAARARDRAAVARLLSQGADANGVSLDGSPALHWAIRADDAEMARALIRAGADVKRANRAQATPLTLSITDANAPMVKLLIEAGAPVNVADPAGETLLMYASRVGDPAIVKLLLDAGATVDAKEPRAQQTALMLAVRADHAPVVDLLIKAGADVDAHTRLGPPPITRPPGAGGGSAGEGIVRSGVPPQGERQAATGGMTPLLYAARDGRLEPARLLLAAGAKIELAEANQMTPLLMALLNDHFAVADLLIAAGANVNARDWYGRAPLFAAAEARNREISGPGNPNGVDRAAGLRTMRLLLEKGADPNAQVKEFPPSRRYVTPLGSLAWVDFTGQTAFIISALSGDVDSMKLLLEFKADPNLATFNGTTALMAAAGVNWVVNQTWDEGPARLLEAVKLCVEHGADVNAVNKMGLAAIHGAANRGSDDIILYLAQKGARLDGKDAIGRTPLTWAEGVFLATNAPEPKPSTIALLNRLMAERRPAQVAAP